MARYGHSCGIVHWLNPISDVIEDFVVVAGGFNGRLLTTSELLFVDNLEAGFVFGPGDVQSLMGERLCTISIDMLYMFVPSIGLFK